MPPSTPDERRRIRRRFRDCPIDCPAYVDTVIETLGDFFSVFHSLLAPNTIFWFRGHSNLIYRLAPTALRYSDLASREAALGLIADMKRFMELKLSRPPAPDDGLGWLQVAQHYGLPTRLLDWTQNAAVALFFVCSSHQDKDGLVTILNPAELNQRITPRLPRILNMHQDAAIIEPYLKLDGSINRRGLRTIAINPTWNTERIALQQGAFTLHGSREFELRRSQASSLLYVPILREFKTSLLSELERVGIGEMFIFPEPEHVCKHLTRHANL